MRVMIRMLVASSTTSGGHSDRSIRLCPMVVAPALAASALAVPRGPVWGFEPRWDGFRTLIELRPGGRWPALPAVEHDLPTETRYEGPTVRGKEQNTMGYIQIIEYKTSRIDELNATLDAWLEQTKGKRLATRGTQTRDRDTDNTYVQIVEFPSYEDAMTNSRMPETSELAAKLAELCDGPPSFRNLDVIREVQM
jgi:hypothetical protein